VSPDLQLTMLN